MAESLTQQKKRLHTIMGQMQKKYGVTKMVNKSVDMDQVVYLVLRDGWDYRKATKALKMLLDEFVDWNEVRVTFVRELCECLASFKFKAMEEKARHLLDTMKAIYDEFNRMHLEFLLEKEFEETRKAFSGFEPMGKANAYLFLQCLMDELDEAPAKSSKTLVMSSEALRVGIRLNLIQKTGSLNVGRKAYMKLLDPTEYFIFQNLFVRHAERFCFSKNPMCKTCFLKSGCAFFKQ